MKESLDLGELKRHVTGTKRSVCNGIGSLPLVGEKEKKNLCSAYLNCLLRAWIWDVAGSVEFFAKLFLFFWESNIHFST